MTDATLYEINDNNEEEPITDLNIFTKLNRRLEITKKIITSYFEELNPNSSIDKMVLSWHLYSVGELCSLFKKSMINDGIDEILYESLLEIENSLISLNEDGLFLKIDLRYPNYPQEDLDTLTVLLLDINNYIIDTGLDPYVILKDKEITCWENFDEQSLSFVFQISIK